MEGITKIVGIIIGILLILLGGYYGRGFLEKGISMAQGILGKTGNTAGQTLENMNQDIILSMTRFTVTIKKGDKIVDTTTVVGYNTVQSYLATYNIDITTLYLNGDTNSNSLTPDTIISLYQQKCSSGDNNDLGSGSGGLEPGIGGSSSGSYTFTSSSSDFGGTTSGYTATVVVSLPECSS